MGRQDNVTRDEIKRKIEETLTRFETDFRDPEKVLEHVHPDCMWTIAGDTSVSGTRTKPEMLAVVAAFPAMTDTGMRITTKGWTIEGDKAAVEGESVTKFKDGSEYTNDYHFIFEFRDGRIIRAKEYMDTARALETFGR